MKMRKFIPVLIFVLAFFVTVGASSCTKEEVKSTETEVVVDEVIPTLEDILAERVGVQVDMGSRIVEGNYVPNEGDTAYDLLVKFTKDQDLELTIKEYDFGLSIEGIGGFMGGTDNKYWLFYVNDVAASQGADATKVKAGDKIEFRFEESKF